MRVVALLVALVSGNAYASSSAEANPLGKVFELIQTLKAQITREGEVEAKAYRKYMAWCDKTAAGTDFEVKTSSKKQAKLGAKIDELKSDVEVGTAKIEDLSKAVSSAEAELKEATAIRTQEKTDFAASEKELLSTVNTLERAITILEKEMAKSGAALAQLDTKNLENIVQTLSAVVSAAGFSSEDTQRLTALVQQQQKDEDADEELLAAPAAAKYETHSGGVVELLEDLKEKAENELAEARKAEAEAAHNYAMLKQSLTDKEKADSKDMTEHKSGVAGAKEEGSVAAGDLDITDKALKESEKSLSMIQKDCMRIAADHEATVQSRVEELKTIESAKKILAEATGGAASFLQVASASKASSKVAAEMRSQLQLANSEVVTIVKKLARAHHSSSLSQLASRIAAIERYGNSAGDPYAKVKGLLTDMITKLEKEASAEATEKAYCDEEMSKTKAKMEQLDDDVSALTSQIDKAAAKSAELKEEVAELQSALAAQAKAQAEMDDIRNGSHDDYVVAKRELTAGLSGIRKALGVLLDFYGGDSAAAMLQEDDDEKFGAFMQQPEAPVKHQKSKGAGGSIIDILEVCESDFATNLAKEETEEADELANYEQMTQQNKLSAAGKKQDVKFKTQEGAAQEKTIADVSSDKESTNTELKAVLEYYSKIQKRCVAQPESYESRKKAREAEIAGLKEVQSVLESAAAFVQKSRRMRRRSHFMEALQ
jgi:chromosome segregation ATPase